MKTPFTTLRSTSLLIALLAFLSIGLTPVDVHATLSTTIATFADPSRNSSNPLFTVDFTQNQNKLTGGWGDDKTGLTLEIPYSNYTIANGNAFTDAWFNMTEVAITSKGTIPGMGVGVYGVTGSGTINFYVDNASTNPLVIITFQSGFVSLYGFAADEFTAENVQITGSTIPGVLSEEMFSFSFANLAHLEGNQNWNDGFTATAAFTSSAIPEPATIFLLGTGGLMMWRTRRRIY